MHRNVRHVMVLGLGDSGLAMARWCARMGWEVTVVDNRAEPPRLSQLHADVPAAQFVSGDFHADLLDATQADAVFKSPGLTPAQVASLWGEARRRGLDRKSTRLNSSHT